MQETQVQFLGQEDLLEKEMTTHSCLGNPMDRQAGWTIIQGECIIGHDGSWTQAAWEGLEIVTSLVSPKLMWVFFLFFCFFLLYFRQSCPVLNMYVTVILDVLFFTWIVHSKALYYRWATFVFISRVVFYIYLSSYELFYICLLFWPGKSFWISIYLGY